MSVAKVLWLYSRLKEWESVAHLFELPDFLTFKCTGSTTRSLCSLVCKWAFDPSVPSGWHLDFWESGGVKKEDLPALIAKCGGDVVGVPGQCLDKRLSHEAALAFGYPALEGIPVSASLIDAYAGALGTLAMSVPSSITSPDNVSHRMAMICGTLSKLGTSTCHIVMSSKEVHIPRVWGPYPDVLLKGYYCTEGGQSLTGKAIETILLAHPLYNAFVEHAKTLHDNTFDLLNASIVDYAKEQNLAHPAALVRNFHIFPELHGNRSPIADPLLRGMISGLQVPLRHPPRLPSVTLTMYYYATILGLCYGTRQILDAHKNAGLEIRELVLSGGLASNSMWAQSLADVTGCTVMTGVCLSDQASLLGSAIAAASAFRQTKGEPDALWTSMQSMSAIDKVYTPSSNPQVSKFHDKKYQVYLRMIDDQYAYKAIMAECT
jgi:FGGY-family pentulose kinase